MRNLFVIAAEMSSRTRKILELALENYQLSGRIIFYYIGMCIMNLLKLFLDCESETFSSFDSGLIQYFFHQVMKTCLAQTIRIQKKKTL